MADTLQSAIDRARDAYPDIPDGVAVALANEILDKAYSTWPINPNSLDISLQADVKEYSLSETIYHIWQAIYFSSATSYNELQGVAYDYLERNYGLWRQDASADPTRFYILGGKIGFHPTPKTTTSGGYPKVTIHYTEKLADLTIAQQIPTAFPDGVFITQGVCWLWAERRRKDARAAQDFRAGFMREMARIQRHLDSRIALDHPRVYYKGLRRMPVV